MDKVFALVGLLVVGAVLVVLGVISPSSFVERGGRQGGGIDSSRLCQARVLEPVDFTVLREVYEHVRGSPFVDEAADPSTLLRSAVVGIFKALGADEDRSTKEIDLPVWVEELLATQRDKDEPDFGIVQEIFERMKQDPRYAFARLEEPSKQHKLFGSAVYALLRLGLRDPFSSYITAEQWEIDPTNPVGFRGQDYEGIGASLNQKDNGEIALFPFNDETPAAKAGVQDGDVVLSVDGKSVEGCNTNDIVQHGRGKAGTSLKMTVRHLNNEVEELTIVRGRVRQNPVAACPAINFGNGRGLSDRDLVITCPIVDARADTERSDVVYVKIEHFTKRAAKDLEAIMPDLMAGNPSGLIIDLRGNPGGDLLATRDILNLFFARGELLARVQYPGRPEEPWIAHTRFSGQPVVPYGLPVIILVGHDPHAPTGVGANSASAAELFPMTFRDYGRAVIIGDGPTSGKGTVTGSRSLRDGEYGGIYIAGGFWLSPAGTFIGGRDTDGDGEPDGGGVIPDIVVTWENEDYDRSGDDPNWDPEFFSALDTIDTIVAIFTAAQQAQ